MSHIQGASRDTVLLFPPSIDEYVTQGNPVRFIDAFLDQLDLQKLGFQRVVAAIEGRPGYDPEDDKLQVVDVDRVANIQDYKQHNIKRLCYHKLTCFYHIRRRK